MKIRTITTGINLKSVRDFGKIEEAASFNSRAKELFIKEGYEVQTTRISTNSWEEYTEGLSEKDIIDNVIIIEDNIRKLGISFFNIGYASKQGSIAVLPGIIRNTSFISCSAKTGDYEKGINYENVRAAAKAIKQISIETENGYGNFRFCASTNCNAGIPFYPASYHAGKTDKFAVGLECSDLAMKAFSNSRDLTEAGENLKDIFESELGKVEKLCKAASEELRMEFGGIDSSLAPSLESDESIAFAFEKLGLGMFGSPGTLSIASVVTKALKSLSVKTCGYSGLMLPVCEDFGLAKRADEEAYSITNLLLYSAVCGCGLDTVPVPGDISEQKLFGILLDTAALANRLNKPLAVRLFPVPGKKAGEMTGFNSPYLIDCRILKVE